MEIDKGNGAVDGDSFARTLSIRVGLAMSSLFNEFIACIQFVCAPTSGKQPYEKSGIEVEGVQNDPSDYANNVTKDAVAISGSVDIGATNQTGRVWGHYAQCGVQPGGDGICVGSERGLNNNGSYQPNLNTKTSKVIDSLVAGEIPGNKDITAFRVLQGGSARSNYGDVAYRSAFVDQENGMVYGIMDNDGNVKWGLTSGGAMRVRRFTLELFETTDGKPPKMAPGDFCMWGDGKTQVTYLVFFDGGNYLKTPLTV
jgi:hypothetical protein